LHRKKSLIKIEEFIPLDVGKFPSFCRWGESENLKENQLRNENFSSSSNPLSKFHRKFAEAFSCVDFLRSEIDKRL
jgi:hypothetical protein